MTSTLSRRTPPDDPAAGGHSRRRWLLIAGAAVAVVALGVWIVAVSSVFGVRTVSVRGEQTVSADQIRTAADIGHGTPLARLDTGAVTRRVETLPGIASARVTTSYPSTVVISVVERVPVGVLRSGGHYLLVDRTGAQYRTVPSRPAHLPLLVLPSGSAARATGAALATVAATLPVELRARVTSIDASDPSTITLQMSSGRVVRWGDATRNATKARIVQALLQRRSQVVDVSDPDRPFTR